MAGNDAAFPIPAKEPHTGEYGLTKREYIATAIFAIAINQDAANCSTEQIALSSIKAADILIDALDIGRL